MQVLSQFSQIVLVDSDLAPRSLRSEFLFEKQFMRPMLSVITRFFTLLPSKLTEEDKHLHFVWSFGLMIIGRYIWPAPWAFLIVFLIGLLKELWDIRWGSGFCFYDIVANLLGSGAALGLTGRLPDSFFNT